MQEKSFIQLIIEEDLDYGSEIYYLYKNKALDSLIQNLKPIKIKATTKIFDDRNYITTEINLLHSINKFISYFYNNFFFARSEMKFILSNFFKSHYSKVFLEIYYYNNDKVFPYYYREYKKIIIDQFIKNAIYLKHFLESYYSSTKFNISEFDMNNDNDVEEMFSFLNKLCNCNKANIYHLFIDVEKSENINFIINIWKLIFDSYLENKSCMEEND